MNKLWAFLFTLILFTSYSTSAREAVGTVSYLRGSAYANNERIKIDQEIYVDDKIKTEKKSVVKIKLIDDSTIIVAPNSTINIDEIESKSKASLISVLKGSLRAVVPKKVKKDKINKLVIKSPIAAFGVRGTDFLVGHTVSNSHIITFSGVVKIASLMDFNKNFNGVNKLLETKGQLIRKGEFSSLRKGAKRFSSPIKINKSQFFALRRNKSFTFKKEKPNRTKKFNTMPKGFPKKKKPSTNDQSDLNQSTLPGGFVELKTGAYVAPDPETSTYDPKNKMYIPSENQGNLNVRSGEYTPPSNYEISPNGDIKIKKLKNKNSTINQGTPGSKMNKKGPPPITPPMKKNGIPAVNLFQNQQQNNNQEFSIPPSTNVKVRIRRGE